MTKIRKLEPDQKWQNFFVSGLGWQDFLELHSYAMLK